MILDFTKPALLGLLLLWQSSPPPPAPATQFRYHRAVRLSSGPPAAQACAVLDAEVLAHSAPSLKDLRLYSGQAEIPYATTLSEPLQHETDTARILNLRSKSGHILFDLQMPRRPYTGLTLEIAARDYIAKAAVSTSNSPIAGAVTPLGTFALFDLTSQHLSHMTDIPLPESTFPYLHIDLVLTAAGGSTIASSSLNLPAIVRSVTVPPSREAQSLYTTTQRAVPMQSGQESVATFKVQSRVPIERISFTLPPNYKSSFSRDVRIQAHATADEGYNQVEEPDRPSATFGVESVTGSIFRVHKTEGGEELSTDSLSIPVSIGSNMQHSAVIEVKIENGSEPPLPVSVELQMRQRRICFDTRSAIGPLVLLYGNPLLDTPDYYRDAALRQAAAHPRIAMLEPEMEDAAAFTIPPPLRKFNQHRPILRWIALLGCVCIFALLVFRRTHRNRHS